jgi:hypothetical protein
VRNCHEVAQVKVKEQVGNRDSSEWSGKYCGHYFPLLPIGPHNIQLGISYHDISFSILLSTELTMTHLSLYYCQ